MMGYLLGEEGRTGVAGAGSGLVGATEFDIMHLHHAHLNKG